MLPRESVLLQILHAIDRSLICMLIFNRRRNRSTTIIIITDFTWASIFLRYECLCGSQIIYFNVRHISHLLLLTVILKRWIAWHRLLMIGLFVTVTICYWVRLDTLVLSKSVIVILLIHLFNWLRQCLDIYSINLLLLRIYLFLLLDLNSWSILVLPRILIFGGFSVVLMFIPATVLLFGGQLLNSVSVVPLLLTLDF